MPLSFEIVPRRAMAPRLYDELVAFCTEAYDEDFAELMAGYGGTAVHVLGYEGGVLATHALWVPCRVQAGAAPPMLAASVEAVATRSGRQGRGLGSEVMARLVDEIDRAGIELGVLWPFDVGWYARLGWEQWRGPIAMRWKDALEALPGDDVMVYRLPRTPPLDLDAPMLVSDEEAGR